MKSQTGESYVVDRHGRRQPVRFDEITKRNEALCNDARFGPLLDRIDAPLLTKMVVERFRNGMTTRELDAETVNMCTQLATHHYHFEQLAARICAADLHRRTPESLRDMVSQLVSQAKRRTRLSDEYVGIVQRGGSEIDARLRGERDFAFRQFGYTTLMRSYALRPGAHDEKAPLVDTQLCERPQHIYMRIALAVHVGQPDRQGHLAPQELFERRLAAAFEYYDLLSRHLVSNATPTVLNSGTTLPQLSSCFQTATGDDFKALFKTFDGVAQISKLSGGVSLWLHNIRPEGSEIASSGGVSSGIWRYIKLLNELQQYANQGGNRPGAFAVYLSVDHDDIFRFLELPLLKGEAALRGVTAPNLKYAMWVPDRFMRVLEQQINANSTPPHERDPQVGDWHLFDPVDAPGLHLVYGAEYDALYERYVAEGRYRRVVKAVSILRAAHKAWGERGVPYWLYKDAINRKSNMRNVGPVCSSNLCTEITIPSWSDHDAPQFARFHPENTKGEYAVCNLAALCLEGYLRPAAEEKGGDAEMDYAALARGTASLARTLNCVIDNNFYPTEECERSNQRHRPIGIGIIGLADVLAAMGIPYGTRKAAQVASAIAAVVYHSAASTSAALAASEGSYASYDGSPVSQGLLTPDLWVEDGSLEEGWEAEIEAATGGVLSVAAWGELRESARRGMRNALLTAYMPTATTSNVVALNECFEPYTSHIYTRVTLAGEFQIVNRHLVRQLERAGLWDEAMRREIISAGGSVSGIQRIPENIRALFQTAREMPSQRITRMVKAMAPWVCQSLSTNIWLDTPSLPKILTFLFDNWKAGLKTGMYYCHTKPAAGTQKASVRADAPTSESPAAKSTVAALAAAAPAEAALVEDALVEAASAEAATAEACRRDDPNCTTCAL